MKNSATSILALGLVVFSSSCIRVDLPDLCKGMGATVSNGEIVVPLDVAVSIPNEIKGAGESKEYPLAGPIGAKGSGHIFFDTLTIANASIDLATVERVTFGIESLNPMTMLPPIALGGYERKSGNQKVDEAVVYGDRMINLIPYMSEQSLKATIRFQGENLTRYDWTANIKVCFDSDVQASITIK